MATKRTTSAKNKKMMSNGATLGGFTIIEVVLVLAIAGLIFLMVFIALPQLQAAQRNTQRREDMSKLNSAIIQYQANNNGKLPTSSTKYNTNTDGGAAFISGYISGAFEDPDGNPYTVYFKTYDAGDADADGVGEVNTEYRMVVVGGAVCGEDGTVVKAKPRDYAVLYKLEGSGVYCSANGGTADNGEADA